MKHYICTGGCEGVAEKPGTCEAIACPKYSKPLIECECADSKHAEVIRAESAKTPRPENR